MKKLVLLLVLAIAWASSPTLAVAKQCSAGKTISEEFSAGGISIVKINALAGYLDISVTKSQSISFNGDACSDEYEWLDRMALDIERLDVEGIGNVLELTVMIPYDDDDFDARYAYMDVEPIMPANIPVEVKDSSGDIIISDVSATQVDDSSGNIRINNNQASLSMRDSSGEIVIRGLQGGLEISDSSGDIDIREVSGSVHIPRDSSGEINIETITGKVSIGSDGSGDIEISKVSADVEIGSDGSGNIKIRDVKGSVTIGSDGSGGIKVADISGNLLITAKGSGDVRTHAIEGEISLPR